MSEELAVLSMVFLVSATVNVALTIGWIRSSLRARRFERHLLDQGASRTTAPDVRTDQLEESVDVIAAKVAQLQKSQEFLGRLLSDRLEKRSRRPAALEATPV